MTPVYWLIWGATAAFGASAVAALVWAIENGQMSNPTSGAGSIFDPDEPVGRASDGFPGVPPEAGEDHA
jgi:hypothetical protein